MTIKPFTSARNGRASWSLDNQHETLKVRIPTQKIQTDNDHPSQTIYPAIMTMYFPTQPNPIVYIYIIFIVYSICLCIPCCSFITYIYNPLPWYLIIFSWFLLVISCTTQPHFHVISIPLNHHWCRMLSAKSRKNAILQQNENST